MKVEVDFYECVKAYAEEQKKSHGYSTDNLKESMLVILDAVKNYEDATNIVLDILESIPKEYRKVFMEVRGYIRIYPEES